MSETGNQLNRVGRWLKTEEEYMAKNFETMTVEDMAATLKRNPITVKKYVEEKLYKSNPAILQSKKTLEFDIERSPIWKELQKQFNREELDTFLYHWATLIAQFKYDVLPTERMQIIDAVRIEILMNRALERTQKAVTEIEDYEAESSDLREQYNDTQDQTLKARISALEAMIANMKTSIINFNKEYKELFVNKQSILRELKATRADRIKRIEDSKETIGSWIGKMLENTDLRRELGVELEKVRLANQIEYERLSEYHKYLDGSIEQPILNSDNLKEDNV